MEPLTLAMNARRELLPPSVCREYELAIESADSHETSGSLLSPHTKCGVSRSPNVDTLHFDLQFDFDLAFWTNF